MIPTKHDMEIWVHVSVDQHVWFGTDTHPAVNSKLDPCEFVEQDWVQSGQSIRVLGDWDNADLIMRLWNAKIAANLPLKIYLARPHRQTTHAGETVSWMRQLDIPPSCGGWHEMTTADYPTYGLISLVQRMEEPRKSDLMIRLLQAHPTWPVFSFIQGGDPYWAAALISFIGDPRWHVDPVRPDRSAAYYWFLGLGRTESAHWAWQAYLRHPVEPLAEYRRVAAVVEAWLPPGQLEWKDAGRPDGFLLRFANSREDPVRGVLAGCRLFARFLRDVWLDRLTPGRKYVRSKVGGVVRRKLRAAKKYSPQLFVPEYFFEEDDCVRAWKKHISRLD